MEADKSIKVKIGVQEGASPKYTVTPKEEVIRDVSGSVKIEQTVKHNNPTTVTVKSMPQTSTLYTVAPIGPDGNETGAEVNVREKEYRKYFSDTTKWKLKKKPK